MAVQPAGDPATGNLVCSRKAELGNGYIAEMVGRIEAIGLTARVKPEAVMVSLADRETKKPNRLRAASS
ncbi:MAG: Ribonuclease H-like [Paenibacillaceae bacterium]|jgi:hypothetical protein|nr:Ribonuclease H-like [Paenibacillaceae bacterium]